MTDRELLEAAAKAAGIELIWPRDPSTRKLLDDIMPRRADTLDNWNPLASDGDALRLAIALRFEVIIDTSTTAAVKRGAAFAREPHGTDRYAATRRAIVRAAAMAQTERAA